MGEPTVCLDSRDTCWQCERGVVLCCGCREQRAHEQRGSIWVSERDSARSWSGAVSVECECTRGGHSMRAVDVAVGDGDGMPSRRINEAEQWANGADGGRQVWDTD